MTIRIKRPECQKGLMLMYLKKYLLIVTSQLFLLAAGCDGQSERNSEPKSIKTGQQSEAKQISHAGTWMRISGDIWHILIQNNTHWVNLEIVVKPQVFPPAPVGFPMEATGGGFNYENSAMIRKQRWSPHWPDGSELPTRIGYHNNGSSVEVQEFDASGVIMDSELFSEGVSDNLDSSLFGTWKMDGEEVFLVANGTDAVRLSGDTLKRLSSVQGNKYEIRGDEVIMDRYCDFKPVGRIGQKTRFKFNRTEKSLVLSRVSESGELISEEKWSLIEAESIAAPAERERMPDLDSAEKYFERAEDQMKNGEFAKAHADYSKAIELDATSGKYLHRRGDNHMARKLYREAIEDYTASIAIRSDRPSNYFDRARANARLKEWEKAMVDYKRYQELAPDAANAYSYIAFVYLQLKDADSAIENINKAIEMEDRNPGHYVLRAAAYFRLEDANNVIADCTKAIEIDEMFVPAYELRADVYRILGQADNAEEDLTRAKQIRADR